MGFVAGMPDHAFRFTKIARGLPIILSPRIFSSPMHANSSISAGVLLETTGEWERRRRFVPENRSRWSVRLHKALRNRSHAYDAFLAPWPVEFIPFTAVHRLRFVAPLSPRAPLPATDRSATLETDLSEWYPEIHASFQHMMNAVRTSQQDSAARGVEYVAFCVPSLADTVEEVFDELRRESKEPIEYEWAKSVRVTQHALDGLGIPSIDLLTPVRAHPDTARLYYRLDGHFNVEGSRFVAEVLADGLLRDYPHLLSPAGVSEATVR